MAEHGNTGLRVKNLKGTSGCRHYRGLNASSESVLKCSVNGCNNMATRACHVIMANQNSVSGRRLIVYMCPPHNADYRNILSIGLHRIVEELPDCNCGYWEG